MLAGGWEMVGGSVFDYRNDDVWWWGKSSLVKASWTWAGADNFSRFLDRSGRGKKVASIKDLDLGDIVLVRKTGDVVVHATIVTKKTADAVFLSYHTNDTLNRDWSTFEKAWAAGHEFIFWHIVKTT
jgi:hypothetical protein